MKRKIYSLALAALLPTAGHSASVDVDFTATLTGTTCEMTLEALNGANVSGSAASGYMLSMGEVGLDAIMNLSAAAQKDFRLKSKNCSVGMNSIKTKISGVGATANYIPNASASNPASNIGMKFKRKATTGEGWMDLSQQIDWTSTEIAANALDMTVALRETTAGAGTKGDFTAKATFTFTYQ